MDGIHPDKVKAGDETKKITQVKVLPLYSWIREEDVPPGNRSHDKRKEAKRDRDVS